MGVLSTGATRQSECFRTAPTLIMPDLLDPFGIWACPHRHRIRPHMIYPGTTWHAYVELRVLTPFGPGLLPPSLEPTCAGPPPGTDNHVLTVLGNCYERESNPQPHHVMGHNSVTDHGNAWQLNQVSHCGPGNRRLWSYRLQNSNNIIGSFSNTEYHSGPVGSCQPSL